MSLKLNSSGGGSVTLQEPNTASALTLGLPAVNGTVITTADSGTVSSTMIAAAAVTPAKLSQPLTLATAQNTTSGTSIDFTGIPSWVRRVTVMLNGVSTNGTSNLLVQLGTSGGVVSTGYAGASSVNSTGVTTTNYSSGVLATQVNAAANTTNGAIIFLSFGSNTWVATVNTGATGNAWTNNGGGSVTLGGTLDRIRLTTVNGTDTFDAGSVNIMYEG